MHPPCTRCAFYRPGLYAGTGFCTKYLIVKSIRRAYLFAEDARKDPAKCSPKGVHFTPKK